MSAHENQALLACLHCGGQAGFVYLGAGHPEWVVECRSCILEGTEEHARAAWNRRDGLLPELRKLRDAFSHYISERDWGEAITLNYDSDAALLELAGARQSTSGIPAPGSGAVEPKCEPAPASSLRRDPKTNTLLMCERCGAHPITHDHVCREKQAAELAERCKWCNRELIAPEEHACYRAWEAGRSNGLLAGRACRHSPRCYSEAQCAERVEYMGDVLRADWKAITVDMNEVRRMALLDAARDLRTWAKLDVNPDWTAGWTDDQRLAVKWCAERLEARAKEVSG